MYIDRCEVWCQVRYKWRDVGLVQECDDWDSGYGEGNKRYGMKLKR